MSKLFKTDMICANCGTINVAPLKGHQRTINGEMKLYFFNCRNEEVHVIVGDIDSYSRSVGL